MPTVAEIETTESPTSIEIRAANQQAREHVAAQLVQTERMRPGGANQSLREILCRRIAG
jgi:hypothetical protein